MVQTDHYGSHMDQHRVRIAQRVVSAMEAAGQSRNGLAKSAGLSKATLLRRLAGRTPFTVEELERIADALDVDVETLFIGDAA